MPSEAKRGKQRIESNRYKRWQTVKYVVLIAGLVAACFGSMAIGWLDPFSVLVRSFGLSILPAFNFAVRAVLAPLENSHIAAIKGTGGTVHAALQLLVLDFRQAHFAQGLLLGISVYCDFGGEFAGDAAVVPVDLSAGCAAWGGIALERAGTAQRRTEAATSATAACCTARGATIRLAAFRGARPNA